MGTNSRTPALAGLLLASVLPTLSACGTATIGGSKGLSKANDDLRTRVAELEVQNRRLESSLEEANAKLASEQRVREGLVPADVLAALPQCAGIELGSLSGRFPADESAPPQRVVIYVEPFDGRRRFIQAVGTIRVEVLELSPTAAADAPRTLAAAALTPLEVREAYRSSFTGTHYTIEIPLDADQAARARSRPLLLRVQYEDALSGKIHEATKMVPAATPSR